MSANEPMVSVVIPTRNRTRLLRRAVDSVLSQVFGDFEIVVVVDGPDEEVAALLQQESDPRVRFHVNPSPLGGAGARNVGVRLARGNWIAFLDDDDLWLPAKLERQMLRLASVGDDVVGFTRLIARAPHGDYLWPRRAPHAGEHISDYLFVRRSLFAGEGGIQTSTIVVPRALLLAYPFDETLGRLQDTDWLLRVFAAGATYDFCPDALTIWHIEEHRDSITASHAADWQPLITWIRERRRLVTRRAYAAFLLVRVGASTAAARDFGAALTVWREAWRHGRPGVTDVVLFFAKWIAPPRLRAVARSWASPAKLRRQ